MYVCMVALSQFIHLEMDKYLSPNPVQIYERTKNDSLTNKIDNKNYAVATF